MTTANAPMVREVSLQPVSTDPTLAMIERLVTDPNADVDKLDRLMQMHERVTARSAEAAFNVAISEAQKEMRSVGADASNPQTHSRYASYEALDRALRPIYTKNGFGLSFDTGEGAPVDYVRVLCYVSHTAGHSRTYRADMPADGKGAKGGDVMTKTHAVGSAMSYGMRYLLKMIFNVAVGEDDDDGNKASAKREPEMVVAPAGFENWFLDMEALVAGGCDWPKLKDAWEKSKEEYRRHMVKTNKSKVEGWKLKAQGGQAVRRG
jgi:hypothetical protein